MFFLKRKQRATATAQSRLQMSHFQSQLGLWRPGRFLLRRPTWRAPAARLVSLPLFCFLNEGCFFCGKRECARWNREYLLKRKASTLCNGYTCYLQQLYYFSISTTRALMFFESHLPRAQTTSNNQSPKTARVKTLNKPLSSLTFKTGARSLLGAQVNPKMEKSTLEATLGIAYWWIPLGQWVTILAILGALLQAFGFHCDVWHVLTHQSIRSRMAFTL